MSRTTTVGVLVVRRVAVSWEKAVWKTRASIPRKRADFSPSEIVTSNEITITVSESYYPKQVTVPYPCSNSEYDEILDAAAALRDLLIPRAQLEINRGNTPEYIEWMGAFTNARHSTVAETITNVRTNNIVDYECDDMANVYAYVYPNDPTHTIYLCSVFWGINIIGGWDTQSGTLAHELTHFSTIGATNDYAYGTTACRNLAINNPNNAVYNADSYEYFCEQYH